MLAEHANYLAQIQRKYEPLLPDTAEAQQATLQNFIEQISLLDHSEDIGTELRKLKALFSYHWAHARIRQTLPFELLGQLQTTFAEASIDKALKAAWSDPQFKRLVPEKKRHADGTVPGLFILGLGKLGGYDLNFSSDVDLIAFYDPDTLPIASMHGRTDITSRVLKKMSQILANNIESEFVWRVDWRLRPNASSMALTMSTEAAEEFYFFRSLPWQHLAMIKARVIAGDINTGDHFLDSLEPYLWRQNLDYQMVDEICRLKKKINQEHPQLKQARTAGSLHNQDHGEGFNLKLGRGGIREIEFVVNAMQLLWGGKKPLLRTKGTLNALQQIANAELLDQHICTQLANAYQYLRWLEDTLQSLENNQTHKLPSEPEQLVRFLALLNLASADLLWEPLSQHRKVVATTFDNMFQQAGCGGAVNALDDAEALTWPADLPDAERDIWDNWHKGFTLYGASPSQANALQPLFIQLAQLLDWSNLDRPAAIQKLHAFFKSIPKGGQYLRLLVQQPNLMRDIASPLLYSPHMANLLEQSPHIVDFLLEPNSTQSGLSELDSEFVLQSPCFEIRLERLRRFVNEQLYLLCLRLVCGEIDSITLQQHLTELAEHTIQLGLTITNSELAFDESPIAVIGMGKLGMRAMAPMSDLDLIFVAKNDVELEQAGQYAHRFQHLMQVRTKEGRAYEMDMRLRPSGRSGPVTVSLHSFEHYQFNSAKTWEHIALTAARSLAGPDTLQESITHVRSAVLARTRNIQQFKLDAAKMLWRLQDQRIGKAKKPGLNIKLRPGGLMELDYLSACACLLAQPSAQVSQKSYDTMVGSSFDGNHSAGTLFADQTDSSASTAMANKIADATLTWRKLQIWSRVLGLDDNPLEQLPPEIAEHLQRDMAIDNLSQLYEKIADTSAWVSSAVQSMQNNFEIDKPPSWEEWQELPVRWSAS